MLVLLITLVSAAGNFVYCRTSCVDLKCLDREYKPEAWSRRFRTPQEALQEFINYTTYESEIATNTTPHKLAIEYGRTPGQKLDIFGIDLPDDAPILVFVHGGFWQSLSRQISRYPAPPLHRSGVKTIVVGYDLCPVVTLPEIVAQFRRAARFIFEYAEIMGSRGVYLAGHSAGAQLVMKTLSDEEFLANTPGSDRLKAAYLISGVYDLRDLVYTSVNKLVQLPEELAVPLSPQFDCYTHLRNRRLRLYVLAGEYDSPTFKAQSRKFFELLRKFRLDVYFKIKEKMDHFIIVECLANYNNYLLDLLFHDMTS